ncbi:cation-translocating P-type ATPase [Photobacterium alginatilyticum]|uniref:Cation-transporting P-type ATPase n=1 Tax=Photobacterium alginatilyticum TaxID=1775171 RepID=A0ABW9YKZ6_9GAMM|nr:cation-transporting P-type ATPase [Photobacterium alginatilyticum]NBI54191.1 cation-transporting P-type ATPase [Photobacterium alginatilyticum]
MTKKWFTEQVDSTLSKMGTTVEQGLSAEEIADRQARYGNNELEEQDKKSAFELFLHQFKNPLIFILGIGAGVSFFTGHLIDAVAITVIIFINALIAFWQEFKAQKGMEALREMAAPVAQVRRDGEWVAVLAKELVPGDILKIHTGDILAADVRIIEANRLSIDEAALTGESEPVDKTVSVLADEHIGLGDQKNMGFMTTMVTSGTGLGVVTATGMKTEVGHIADMMANTEETKTPMQIRMDTIAKTLMAAALAVVAVICVFGLYQGMPWLEIINTGISLSVAAIPEGLPTVISIVLTMGSTRMVKSNALAKQLSAIETLGSTTVICSDKTGTLTQNQMQVMKAYDTSGRYWDVSGKGFSPEGEFKPVDHYTNVKNSPEMLLGLKIATLCNDAEYIQDAGRSTVRGNPTEGALIVAAAKAGLQQKQMFDSGDYTIVEKFPFDSERKMASVVVKTKDGKHFLALKGAPDVVLNHASGVMVDGETIALNQTTSDGNLALAISPAEKLVNLYDAAIQDFAHQALRTLAVGFRELSEADLSKDYTELESDVTVLGLFGIMDPPRPEVRDAVNSCYEAGVRTVMITGDHALTAAAIAREIGIIRCNDDLVVTGSELDDMSDEKLQEICPKVAVFARVTPEHKLRIVQAQQFNNEVAAMTGDGVNDAPALRRADIGVAMGITGTSVAKDSGDLILLDDNFSTIVKAVRQGRQIFDNLRKFIRQALTANVGEVSVILFAFLAMGPETVLPLTPLMILWINLVSDGLPALALGVEPEEKDLMERKPRKRNESFFGDHLGTRIILRGLALGGMSFLAFSWALGAGYSAAYAQTVAFATLIFAQLWHLFDSRTFTTLYRKNPFTNVYLLVAVVISSTLSLGVIYTSVGQLIFSTEALSAVHMVGIILASSLPTLAISYLKERTKIKFV